MLANTLALSDLPSAAVRSSVHHVLSLCGTDGGIESILGLSPRNGGRSSAAAGQKNKPDRQDQKKT